ncbi:hypothetical protein Vadar_021550 [Vaccinium darrowii]|uniref:Uncharacterized protein n=1 Tax=Vaccinium darrowii TaxID=229202 RepID=A0ACB7YXA9_9ERIC|nr:hypothetical protein Vadar_021550 [Vaccinium darrowii]
MVHEFIENSRFKIDFKLGTALADMYAKCGDIDNSLKIFNAMSKKELFAWSAMIVGLANQELGPKYFKPMNDIHGITSKLEHYGCMVDILGRAGRVQESRELIRSMPFAPDAIIWRAFLEACVIYKNVELAEEAAAHLLALEHHVDGNYILLCNIYSGFTKWDKVMNIRRRMKSTDTQKGPGSSSIEVDNALQSSSIFGWRAAGSQGTDTEYKEIQGITFA